LAGPQVVDGAQRSATLCLGLLLSVATASCTGNNGQTLGGAEPDSSPPPREDASDGSPPSSDEAHTLPLEVLGLPGTDANTGKQRVSASVTLEVTDADWAAAQAAGGGALALTLHNILKPRYAWVSINGADPIDLGARNLPFAKAAMEP
jgi:hypothetical protein